MFPVSRPYRQAIATFVLVVVSVLPTLYVVMTAWRISRPGHRHEVEAEIGRMLGVQVTLDAVRYPRPGEVVYSGVTFKQEEPRKKGLVEVGRAKVIRLQRSDRELTLEAEGLRIRAESPRLAMAQVGTWLQRSGDSTYERIGLTAHTLDLDLGAGVPPYQMREVVGNFLTDEAEPTVRVSYRVVSPGASTRCELTLTRDRRADPVRTTLAFKTMEGLPLPAKVLAPFFDTEDWLGGNAKVEGALTLRQEGAKDWEAEFQGGLLDIDLSNLVNGRFPNHRLSGRGRLTINSARWTDRPGQGFGWAEARGELDAGPGVIGFGLLQALRTEMHFRPGPKLARTVSAGLVDLEFRSMLMSFAMTPDGELKIRGQVADDAVVMGASAPLAFAPQGAANVRGLIKCLFPVTEINHAEMVPLTEKSRLLLCLPVPPDVAVKTTNGN